MKRKILTALATFTIIGGTVPLLSISGCSTSKEITINFSCGEGGTLIGDTTIKVNKDTAWKDIKKPTYNPDDYHQFYGWVIGETIIKDDDIISTNINVLCKFEQVTKIDWFNCTFNQEQKTATIVSLLIPTDIEEITVPSKIIKDGVEYAVVELNHSLFSEEDCTFIRHITLPYTFTKITSDNKFEWTKAVSLETIKIDPNNPVFTSRDSKGNECNCIMEIATKKVVNGVGNVTIPDNAETIDTEAFKLNKTIKDVIIPDNIKDIGDYAFTYSSIVNLTISGGVKTIGEDVFSYCPRLHKVIIENGVEIIGINAFRECPLLDKVVLPNTIVKIDDYAFSGCQYLKHINLQEGLREIGKYAFLDNQELETITLPNSLEVIGYQAFNHTQIKEIHIGPNLQTIGYYQPPKPGVSPRGSNEGYFTNAFVRCNLDKITVDPNNPYFSSRDLEGNECNILWQKNSSVGDKLLIASWNKSWIPSNIKAIGTWAYTSFSTFSGHHYINPDGDRELVIPDNVEHIVDQAFQFAWIDTLKIGKNLVITDDNDQAFHQIFSRGDVKVDPANQTITSQDADGNECHCIMNKNRTELILATSHQSLSIPTTISFIHPYAYGWMNLMKETPVFDNNVTIIGQYAFENCSLIRKVTIQPNYEFIGEGAFGDLYFVDTLYFDKDIKDDGWPEQFSTVAFKGSTFDHKTGVVYVRNYESFEIIRENWPHFATWDVKLIK